MKKIFNYDIPIFWAEGKPKIDYDSFVLEITGDVKEGFSIGLDEIMNTWSDEVSCRLTSVTRWSVRLNWKGLFTRKLLNLVSPYDEARFVKFISFGEEYTTVVPIEALNHDRAILAWWAEGDVLPVEYGGPVRVVFPHLWGYKSAKSIVKIVFQREYQQGYWEERGYSDTAEILPSKIFDVNEKKTKFHSGAEVLW